MKVITTVSVDPELVKKAKEMQINVSGELNKALKEATTPKIAHNNNDGKQFCKTCDKEVNEGYRCDEHNFVLCMDCGWEYPMHKCKHDKRGEHFHYKFINEKISHERI